MTEYSLVRAMKAQNDMRVPFAMQILPSTLREIFDKNIIDGDLVSHDGILDDIYAEYERLIPEDRDINIYDCARAVYTALVDPWDA